MRYGLLFSITALILYWPDAMAVREDGVRWFGSSEEDFAHAAKLAGVPLRVKARFVRCLDPATSGKADRARLRFLVEAAGGELRCEMNGRGDEADLVRDMKRCTPVVMEGSLNAKGKVFTVKRIVQGWGTSQLEGAGEQ
jgi:hypothetical protein